MSITFVTTTSYGTWLPGDAKGYVQYKQVLPANPPLRASAKRLLKGSPVLFSETDCEQLFESLLDAAEEFHYRISDVAIESWHLHWIAWHGDDKDAVMAGRLKNRMRQEFGRGRIWTKGFCGEPVFDEQSLAQIQEYIARHAGCRMSDGVVKVAPQRGGLPA